jgi:hypothetical protein
MTGSVQVSCFNDACTSLTVHVSKVWDSVSGTKVRDLRSHVSRVGTLAWSSSMLASGSRDRVILVQVSHTVDSFIPDIDADEMMIA